MGAAILLAALILTAFWPMASGRQSLFWGDIGLYFLPQETFAQTELRAGRLPLWNPSLLCGVSAVGNPQSWLLYPITALLPFVTASHFLSLTILFHLWLAGLGVFALLRATGLSAGAAFLGAVVFAFGGQLVSKEQFPNMVQASAFLPWALWLAGRVSERAKWRDALALGIILGLQLLAAHAQMSLLTLSLLPAWAWHRRAQSVPRPPILRLFGLFFGSLTLAAGLAAGALLPIFETLQATTREHLTFAQVNRFFFPVAQWTNWIWPTRFGHPLSSEWRARGNFWETCCYVGGLPAVLAFFGCLGRARRETRFWLGLFVVALLLTLGKSGLLYEIFYTVLPGWSKFHDPARVLVWAALAVAALAAQGWETLAARLPSHRALISLLVILIAWADLARFDRAIYPLAAPSEIFSTTPAQAALLREPFLATKQGRTLAPETTWVWNRFSSPRAYRSAEPGFAEFWTDTLTPNLPALSGLLQADGYEPVTSRIAEKRTGVMNAGLLPKADPDVRRDSARWNGLASVRVAAVYTDAAPSDFHAPPGWRPFDARPALPRPGAPPDRSRTVYLTNFYWQPRARLAPDDVTRGPVSGAPVPLSENGPTRLTLTPNPDQPASLLLADSMTPGWQADLDGQPTPIRADGMGFRLVRLPTSGPHIVRFTYAPTAFRVGLYFSLLSAGVSLGLAFSARGGKGRRRV